MAELFAGQCRRMGPRRGIVSPSRGGVHRPGTTAIFPEDPDLPGASMMAKTTADVLVERLMAWGVEVVFGLPGDGINGFMEALRKHRDKIRFIQVRHEEGGRVRGLRLRQVHRAAGRLHRHQRPRRHPPAQRPLRRQDGRRPGAGDHRADLPRPDGHALPAGGRTSSGCSRTSPSSTSRSTGPKHAHGLVDAACRAALSSRGVAHLNCPNDWQELDRRGVLRR